MNGTDENKSDHLIFQIKNHPVRLLTLKAAIAEFQEKKLYYYKVNKVGARINRSMKLMHGKFEELLNAYTIDKTYLEPLKQQLAFTWENLTEASTT